MALTSMVASLSYMKKGLEKHQKEHNPLHTKRDPKKDQEPYKHFDENLAFLLIL